MAKRLDDHDWGTSKYPWSDWMDGGVWEIVQGSDFHTDPKIMRVALHNKAHKRLLKVRTTIRQDVKGRGVITFQYWNPKRVGSIPPKGTVTNDKRLVSPKTKRDRAVPRKFPRAR